MGDSARRWGTGLLIVAILSALGLCLPALRGQALALDEHVSYYCSGAPSVGELWQRCEDVAVLPPLSHLLERAALKIGGRSESVFRLPSLIAYVLAVPAAAWLGRLAGGPLAGGLIALIVAWHPGMVDEVRFGRCYGLVLLLAAVSTAALLRWRREPARRPWLFAWGVSAAALCWTHYLAAPLVAAQALLIIVTAIKIPRSRRGPVSSWATISILGVGLACAPLAPALVRLSEWAAFIEFQRVPATFSGAIGAAWTLPAAVIVGLAAGWSRSKSRMSIAELPSPVCDRIPIGPAVFLWLAPLAVIAAMALLGRPMLASPRYRVMIVPAAALTMGLVLSRSFRPPAAVCWTAAALVLSAFLHGFSPGNAARLANPIEEEWKKAGLELAPLMDDPGVLVFTQSGLAEGVLLPLLPDSPRLRTYLACRLGGFYTRSERALPIPMLWDVVGALHDDYRALLNPDRVREVRIVGANDTDLNSNSVEVFAEFLRSSGFQRTSSESRPGLVLSTYEAKGGPTTGSGPAK